MADNTDEILKQQSEIDLKASIAANELQINTEALKRQKDIETNDSINEQKYLDSLMQHGAFQSMSVPTQTQAMQQIKELGIKHDISDKQFDVEQWKQGANAHFNYQQANDLIDFQKQQSLDNSLSRALMGEQTEVNPNLMAQAYLGGKSGISVYGDYLREQQNLKTKEEMARYQARQNYDNTLNRLSNERTAYEMKKQIDFDLVHSQLIKNQESLKKQYEANMMYGLDNPSMLAGTLANARIDNPSNLFETNRAIDIFQSSLAKAGDDLLTGLNSLISNEQVEFFQNFLDTEGVSGSMNASIFGNAFDRVLSVNPMIELASQAGGEIGVLTAEAGISYLVLQATGGMATPALVASKLSRGVDKFSKVAQNARATGNLKEASHADALANLLLRVQNNPEKAIALGTMVLDMQRSSAMLARERSEKTGQPFEITSQDRSYGAMHAGLNVLGGIGSAVAGTKVAKGIKNAVVGNARSSTARKVAGTTAIGAVGLGASMGIESTTELAQTYIEQLAKNGYNFPNLSWILNSNDPMFAEAKRELLDSAVAGGALGGVLGSAGMAYGGLQKRKSTLSKEQQTILNAKNTDMSLDTDIEIVKEANIQREKEFADKVKKAQETDYSLEGEVLTGKTLTIDGNTIPVEEKQILYTQDKIIIQDKSGNKTEYDIKDKDVKLDNNPINEDKLKDRDDINELYKLDKQLTVEELTERNTTGELAESDIKNSELTPEAKKEMLNAYPEQRADILSKPKDTIVSKTKSKTTKIAKGTGKLAKSGISSILNLSKDILTGTAESFKDNSVKNNLSNVESKDYYKIGTAIFKSLDSLYDKEKSGEVNKGLYIAMSNLVGKLQADSKSLAILGQIAKNDEVLSNISKAISEGDLGKLSEELVSDDIVVDTKYIKEQIDDLLNMITIAKSGESVKVNASKRMGEAYDEFKKVYESNKSNDTRLVTLNRYIQTQVYNTLVGKGINQGGKFTNIPLEVLNLINSLDSSYNLDKIALIELVETLGNVKGTELQSDKENLKEFRINTSLSKKIQHKITTFSMLNNEYVNSLSKGDVEAFTTLETKMKSYAIEALDEISQVIDNISSETNSLNDVQKSELANDLFNTRELLNRYASSLGLATTELKGQIDTSSQSLIDLILDSILRVLGKLKHFFLSEDIQNYIVNGDTETRLDRLNNVYKGFEITSNEVNHLITSMDVKLNNKVNYEPSVRAGNGDMVRVKDKELYSKLNNIKENYFNFTDKNLKEAFVDYAYNFAGKSDIDLANLARFLRIPRNELDSFKNRFKGTKTEYFTKVNKNYYSAKQNIDNFPKSIVFYNTPRKDIFDALPLVASSILDYIITQSKGNSVPQVLLINQIQANLDFISDEWNFSRNDINIMTSLVLNMLTNTIKDSNGKPEFYSYLTYESIAERLSGDKVIPLIKELKETLDSKNKIEDKREAILDFFEKHALSYNRTKSKEGMKLSASLLAKGKYLKEFDSIINTLDESITRSDMFKLLNEVNTIFKNKPNSTTPNVVTGIVFEDSFKNSAVAGIIRDYQATIPKAKITEIDSMKQEGLESRSNIKFDTKVLEGIEKINDLDVSKLNKNDFITYEQFLALKHNYDNYMKSKLHENLREYRKLLDVNDDEVINPYFFMPVQIPIKVTDDSVTFETMYITNKEFINKFKGYHEKLDKLKVASPSRLPSILTAINNELKDIGEVVTLLMINKAGNEKTKNLLFNKGIPPKVFFQPSGRESLDLPAFNGLRNKYVRSIYRTVTEPKEINVKKLLNAGKDRLTHSNNHYDYADLLGVFADALGFGIDKPISRKLLDNTALDRNNKTTHKFNTWVLEVPNDMVGKYKYVTLDYALESLANGTNKELNEFIVNKLKDNSKEILGKETMGANAEAFLRYIDENNTFKETINIKDFRGEVDGSNTGPYETALHTSVLPQMAIELLTSSDSKLMSNMAKSLDYPTLQEKLEATKNGDVYVKVATQLRDISTVLPDDNPLTGLLKRIMNVQESDKFKALRDIGKKFLMTPFYGAGLKDVFDIVDKEKFYASMLDQAVTETLSAMKPDGTIDMTSPFIQQLAKFNPERFKSAINNPSQMENLINSFIGKGSKAYKEFEFLGLYIDVTKGIPLDSKSVQAMMYIRNELKSNDRNRKKEENFIKYQSLFNLLEHKGIIWERDDGTYDWSDGDGFIKQTFGDLSPVLEFTADLTRIWQDRITSIAETIMLGLINEKLNTRDFPLAEWNIKKTIEEGISKLVMDGQSLTELYEEWGKELGKVLTSTFKIQTDLLWQGKGLSFTSSKAHSSLEASNKLNQLANKLYKNFTQAVTINATSNVSPDGMSKYSNFSSFLDYTFAMPKVAPLMNHYIEAMVVSEISNRHPDMLLTIYDGLITQGGDITKVAHTWNELFGEVTDDSSISMYQLAKSFIEHTDNYLKDRFNLSTIELSYTSRIGLAYLLSKSSIFTRINTENIVTASRQELSERIATKEEVLRTLSKADQIDVEIVMNEDDLKYLSSNETVKDFAILDNKLAIYSQGIPKEYTEVISVDMYDGDKLRDVKNLTDEVNSLDRGSSLNTKILLKTKIGSPIEGQKMAIALARNRNLKQSLVVLRSGFNYSLSEEGYPVITPKDESKGGVGVILDILEGGEIVIKGKKQGINERYFDKPKRIPPTSEVFEIINNLITQTKWIERDTYNQALVHNMYNKAASKFLDYGRRGKVIGVKEVKPVVKSKAELELEAMNEQNKDDISYSVDSGTGSYSININGVSFRIGRLANGEVGIGVKTKNGIRLATQVDDEVKQLRKLKGVKLPKDLADMLNASILVNPKPKNINMEIDNTLNYQEIDIDNIVSNSVVISLDSVKSKVNGAFGNDRISKSLLDAVFSNLPHNLEIKQSVLPKGVNGLYTIHNNTPTIVVSMEADIKTIFHELIHASTKNALTNPLVVKNTQNSINEIIRIKDYIQYRILQDNEFSKSLGIERGTPIYDEIFVNDIDLVAEFMSYFLSDKDRLNVLNKLTKNDVLEYEKSLKKTPTTLGGKIINLLKIFIRNALNILSPKRLDNSLYSMDLGTILVNQTKDVTAYNIQDKVDNYVRSRLRNVYNKTEAIFSGAIKLPIKFLLPEEKKFVESNNLTEEDWKVLKEKAYLDAIRLGRRYKFFSPFIAMVRGDLSNPITRNAYISVFKNTIMSYEHVIGRELSRLANDLRFRREGSNTDLSAKSAGAILGTVTVAQSAKENAKSSAKVATNAMIEEYASDIIKSLQDKESKLYKEVDNINNVYLDGLNPEQKFRHSLGFISTIGLNDLIPNNLNDTADNKLFNMALEAFRTKNTEAIGREYHRIAREIIDLIINKYGTSKNIDEFKEIVTNVITNGGRILGRSRLTREYNELGLKNVEGLLHLIENNKINNEIIKFSNQEDTSIEYDKVVSKLKTLVSLGSILEYGVQDTTSKELNGFISVLDTTMNGFYGGDNKHLIRLLSHTFHELVEGAKIRKAKQVVGDSEEGYRFKDSEFLDLATSYFDAYTPFEWNEEVHLMHLLDNQSIEYYNDKLEENFKTKDEAFAHLEALGYKLVRRDGREYDTYLDYINENPSNDNTVLHFRYIGNDLLKNKYLIQNRIAVGSTSRGMEYNLNDESLRDVEKEQIRKAIELKNEGIIKLRETKYKEYMKEFHGEHTYFDRGIMKPFDSRSQNKGRISLDRLSHFNLTKVSYDIADIMSASAGNRARVQYEGRYNQELAEALLDDTIRMESLDDKDFDRNNYVKVLDLADSMLNIEDRFKGLFNDFQKLAMKQILNTYNNSLEGITPLGDRVKLDKPLSALYMRREVVEMLFGKEEQSFAGYMANFFGRRDAKTKKVMNKLEKGVKEFVNEYKNNVILRTPEIIIDNFVGNLASVTLAGVSPDRAIASLTPLADSINRYYEDMKTYNKLLNEYIGLKSKKDKAKSDKLYVDILKIVKRIKSNRVFVPMMRGLDSNIVDDLDPNNSKNDTLLDTSIMKATDLVTEHFGLSNETSYTIKSFVSNIALSPSSEIMQVARQATRLGDLIPKMLIYEQKLSEGMSPKEAVDFSANFLVDYNLPITSTILSMNERLGLGFFVKWFVGIQRIAVKSLLDKPITSSIMILLQSVLGLNTIPSELSIFRSLPFLNLNTSSLFRWNGVL